MKSIVGTFLMLFFSFTSVLSAQTTGTVVDEEGTPLFGASIVKKGTNVGATTDFDGAFSIEASNGDTLVISYIGFDTKEVVVRSSV